jgi:hypothetical protein
MFQFRSYGLHGSRAGSAKVTRQELLETVNDKNVRRRLKCKFPGALSQPYLFP